MKITGFITHGNFKKQFSKLTKEIQLEFKERIYIFLKQSSHILLNNHPLHGDWNGYWSINITGDVRAIYKIEGTIAILVAIGTHNQLYN